MKKLLAITAMILSLCLLLCGCQTKPQVTVDPKFGNTMDFEHEGFKITLTDGFTEVNDSEDYYHIEYVSDFCYVKVKKVDFSKMEGIMEGIADMSLEEFTTCYPEATYYKNYELHINDDHCYYVRHEEDLTSFYNFCYKGSDAFYVVLFYCRPDDMPEMEEPFFAWASGVEVE